MPPPSPRKPGNTEVKPEQPGVVSAISEQTIADLLRQHAEIQQSFVADCRSIRDSIQAVNLRLERVDGTLSQMATSIVKVDDLVSRTARLETLVETMRADFEREKDRHDEEDAKTPDSWRWAIAMLLSGGSLLLYLFTALLKK